MKNHMKIFFLVTILMASFSINSCSDDGDDGGGIIPITFLDKYEMSEWQREAGADLIYMRFERDHPIYHKILGKHFSNSKDCYILRFEIASNPEPVFNILDLREDYIKYEVEYFLDGYPTLLFREEYTFFYKNGEMQEHAHLKEPGPSIRVEHGWEKSDIEINSLNMCD